MSEFICTECGSRWDKEELHPEAMECLACGAKVVVNMSNSDGYCVLDDKLCDIRGTECTDCPKYKRYLDNKKYDGGLSDKDLAKIISIRLNIDEQVQLVEIMGNHKRRVAFLRYLIILNLGEVVGNAILAFEADLKDGKGGDVPKE